MSTPIPELKPCPFCRMNLTKVIKPTLSEFAIRCRHCGAQGPTEDRMHVAASEWNGVRRIAG